MDRFLGLQYPLMKTPRGILAQKKEVSQIKADLLQLLLTHPGERVMLPNFGTPLKELIFDQNDSILEVRARQMIERSIAAWEPRIVINNIHVSSKASLDDLDPTQEVNDIGHILHIRIDFIDPQNITEIQALVLNVPLSS